MSQPTYEPGPLFITGGTGYVGSRLIPRLLERGHEVRVLARKGSTGKLPPGCRIIDGNPLDSRTFAKQVTGASTFVQLVGVAKPAPWKGAAFRAVDLVSARASLEAAMSAAVRHFVYVSAAHPAPIMKAYIAVRTTFESEIRAAGVPATFIRPWYILGPGHWWPVLLEPIYKLMKFIPATKKAAQRLGLVTIDEMLAVLAWAVEHPSEGVRIIDVPEIRRLARIVHDGSSRNRAVAKRDRRAEP
jgi:uncharacterized protein YbjT (DUF2867 family)